MLPAHKAFWNSAWPVGRLAALIGLLAALLLVAACGGSSNGSYGNTANQNGYGTTGNQGYSGNNGNQGYSSSGSQTQYVPPDLNSEQQYGGAYQGGTATGNTPEGAQFAQWVLQQDPQHQYITDAVVLNDQTLGVKVQPTITRGGVQNLLTSLAQGMANTFPYQQLTVIAFYQSGAELARADYDPATGQTNVQFVQ